MDVNKYEKEQNKKHDKRTKKYEKQIDKIIADTIKQVAILSTLVNFDDTKPFVFNDYPTIKKAVSKLLEQYRKNIEVAIINGVRAEWTYADNKNNEIFNWFLGGDFSNDEQTQRAIREKAIETFIQRKTNGMNLSDRVWNLKKSFKEELEMSIDLGLRKGTSADSLGRVIRNFLKEPSKLFRRVRDEHGELQLSKNAEAYHPGRGVSRSSAKNAKRLAANEINIAYRRADSERWQRMDFILGIKIELSNNHTLNGEPFYDICDELAGIYPKDFVFTGWHPNCRCHVLSIIASKEERKAHHQNGTPYKYITDTPANFKKWVSENQERLSQSNSLPYFVMDNEKYFPEMVIKNKANIGVKDERDFNNNLGADFLYRSYDMSEKLTPTELKDISVVQNKLDEFAKNNPNYFPRGYKGIVAVSEENNFLHTDTNGLIVVNFATNKDGFNAGESLLSAINKINTNEELTFNEEYSIEALWHEILHNKSANTTILPEIDSPKGFSRLALETTNQYVARNTYDLFLKKLGGEEFFKYEIIDNGYGYSKTVKNLSKILDVAKIDKKRFVAESYELLMGDYKDFDKKIGNLLYEMSNNDWKIKNAFNFIERTDFDAFLLEVLR